MNTFKNIYGDSIPLAMKSDTLLFAATKNTVSELSSSEPVSTLAVIPDADKETLQQTMLCLACHAAKFHGKHVAIFTHDSTHIVHMLSNILDSMQIDFDRYTESASELLSITNSVGDIRTLTFESLESQDHESANIIMSCTLSVLDTTYINNILVKTINKRDTMYVGFDTVAPPITAENTWYHVLTDAFRQTITDADKLCRVYHPPISQKNLEATATLIGAINKESGDTDPMIQQSHKLIQCILQEVNIADEIDKCLEKARKDGRKATTEFLLNMLVASKKNLDRLEQKAEELLVKVKLADLKLQEVVSN